MNTCYCRKKSILIQLSSQGWYRFWSGMVQLSSQRWYSCLAREGIVVQSGMVKLSKFGTIQLSSQEQYSCLFQNGIVVQSGTVQLSSQGRYSCLVRVSIVFQSGRVQLSSQGWYTVVALSLKLQLSSQEWYSCLTLGGGGILKRKLQNISGPWRLRSPLGRHFRGPKRERGESALPEFLDKFSLGKSSDRIISCSCAQIHKQTTHLFDLKGLHSPIVLLSINTFRMYSTVPSY